MSETHDSELYVAATNALASEASDVNTFEKMLSSAMSYTDSSEFKKEVALIEDIIKSEFSLTKMPSPWRSAKSVCYGALALGIGFLDENGNQKGKTALQNEIKLIKTGGEEEKKTPFEKCIAHTTALAKLIHELDSADLTALRAVLSGI